MTIPMIESVKKITTYQYQTNKSKTPLNFYIYEYIEILNFPPIKNQRDQKDATRQTSSPPPGRMGSHPWDPVVHSRHGSSGHLGRGINQNPILFYGTYNKSPHRFTNLVFLSPGIPILQQKKIPPVFPTKSLAGKSIVNRLLEGFTSRLPGDAPKPHPPKKNTRQRDKWLLKQNKPKLSWMHSFCNKQLTTAADNSRRDRLFPFGWPSCGGDFAGHTVRTNSKNGVLKVFFLHDQNG